PPGPQASRPRQHGRSATSVPRWPNSAPAASRSKTSTPGANDRSPGGRAELDSQSCPPSARHRPRGARVRTALLRNGEVALVLESASTHAMIAVKDLGRAKEFYGGMLGLTASDERHGSGIRYETRAGSWFLVYRSEFAGTAKSTCMRFEVEDVE